MGQIIKKEFIYSFVSHYKSLYKNILPSNLMKNKLRINKEKINENKTRIDKIESGKICQKKYRLLQE